MGLAFPLILFGILQGFTEVFPVSSSGHLSLASQILKYHNLDLKLAVALHIGSLIAITLYFHKDITTLWLNFHRSLPALLRWMQGNVSPFALAGEQRLSYYMVLSLMPVMFEGWFLERIAAQVFEHPYWASLFLMINAGLLLITARITHGERTLKELSLRDFLLIGSLQGLAVLPGISRLGIVICTGLWLSLNWQEAIRLAYLISIPVIAGSMLLEGNGILRLLQSNPNLATSLFMAMGFAAIFSFLGMKFLTSRYLERRKLAFFGSYCFMVGMASLIYLYFWL